MKGIFILLSIVVCISSLQAQAQEDKTPSKGIFSFNIPIHQNRYFQVVPPQQRLQQTLQNIQFTKPKSLSDQNYTSWRAFKNQLKSLVAVQVSHSFQFGLNSIKVQSLDPRDADILDINLDLQKTAGERISARGYGVEFKLKLD